MKPELRICPFCGGKPNYNSGYMLRLDEDGDPVGDYDEENARIWFGVSIDCPVCGCVIERKRMSSESNPDGWHEQLRSEVIDVWNRRIYDCGMAKHIQVNSYRPIDTPNPKPQPPTTGTSVQKNRKGENDDRRL